MMKNYNIQSKKLDRNRIFILQKSKLEKRLDPFYYIPELVELEKKILAKQPKKLRDYVMGIASGATPSRGEEEKYYSDKNNGVPFLRVQNVTPYGIDLTDVKYINKETHEGYLKRSQVFENDLLVTITGRIASSAVAPKGFEGNINQHSVVIKTENKKTSERIAAYLNSEIGQKLALRRATGGTRPALDYMALLSIPIINDEKILTVTQKAIEKKVQSEIAAEKLLASIDDYLLSELGIKIPVNNNIDEERVGYQGFDLNKQNLLVKNGRLFLTGLREVTGGRLDPFYQQRYFIKIIQSINKSKYNVVNFRHLINALENGVEIRNYIVDGGLRYLRVTDLGKDGLNDNSIRYVEVQTIPERIKLNNKCILISRSGSLGLANVFEPKLANAILSSHIFKVELNTELIDPSYIEAYLRSKTGQLEIFRNNNGGVIPEINQEALKSIHVIVPPLSKQQEIVLHISEIRKKAKSLQMIATNIMESAKRKMEKLILEE